MRPRLIQRGSNCSQLSYARLFRGRRLRGLPARIFRMQPKEVVNQRRDFEGPLGVGFGRSGSVKPRENSL